MKHLGNVLICGAAYPVLEGNAGECEEMDGANGVCLTGERQIWLKEGMPASKVNDILTHEVLHGINDGAGVIYATAAALGLHEDDPRLRAWEEVLVRILTPHITAAFGPARLGLAPKKGAKRVKRTQ